MPFNLLTGPAYAGPPSIQESADVGESARTVNPVPHGLVGSNPTFPTKERYDFREWNERKERLSYQVRTDPTGGHALPIKHRTPTKASGH